MEILDTLDTIERFFPDSDVDLVWIDKNKHIEVTLEYSTLLPHILTFLSQFKSVQIKENVILIEL